MCGLAGFVDSKGMWSEDDLRRMANSIVHRGPDDEGISVVNFHGVKIGMAHRRLSILDLSPLGHQPMELDNLRVVYNGEIYNYREIRKELIQFGFSFSSDSDTEVLLRAFQHWGIQCLGRFIGMFAFAILDTNKRKLWLCRDRVGIKPLYYSYRNNGLLFGSEIKALAAANDANLSLDSNSLTDFLRYGYTVGEFSIYTEVKKVKPGHYIEYDLKSLTGLESKYWCVDEFYKGSTLVTDENLLLEELEELITSACKYRMVSDVPVGVFLSGGYDSSLVTALIQKNISQPLKTFTIGFAEKSHNEAPFAAEIANYLGTDHHELICTEQDALALIPNLPYFFDEPFGDSSAIPTMLVSALAKQHVTVALSADAGDEVFGGYTRYENILNNAQILSRFPKSVRKQFGGLLSCFPTGKLTQLLKKGRYEQIAPNAIDILSENNLHEALLRIGSRRIASKNLEKLLAIPTSYRANQFDTALNDFEMPISPLHQLMLIDYKTYLTDDILVKIDRAAMSVSLEGREPLLDHRIIERVATLPENHKIRSGNKKYLLKKIAERHIPTSLLDRPKKGFSIPINNWMRNDLRPLLRDMLSFNRISQQGIFEASEVERIVNKFYLGNDQNAELIWFLLMFQMWHEEWMDN